MNRLLGKVVFGGLIAGAYFLVTTTIQSNDFKEKSVNLMKEQGEKVIAELDKYPGCAGQYWLQTTLFDKDSFFSKTATGRSIYTNRNNHLLDMKWTAELVDDGRMVIVQPSDRAGLQSTLTAMMLTSCRGS